MMMTSGAKVHYKSMFDAGRQIVAAEGVKSLFKGAGANILRGVAGAGVLSLYDKMQELMFGKARILQHSSLAELSHSMMVANILRSTRVDPDKLSLPLLAHIIPAPRAISAEIAHDHDAVLLRRSNCVAIEEVGRVARGV